MSGRRPAAVLVSLLAALAGCGGTPTPAATGDPCAVSTSTTSLPGNCAPTTESTADPSSTVTATGQLPPLRLSPDPGQLAAGGNDTAPSLTTATFSVTLPAGTRLKIHVACAGKDFMKVTTVPDSKARLELKCGAGGSAAEVAVLDPAVVSTPTHYVVTVKTTAPARWWVNISGSKQPAASPI